MPDLTLDFEDYFLLARAVAFSEIKFSRRIADVFGDELGITPESPIAGAAFNADRNEIAHMAMRTAGFFGLGREDAAKLAEFPTMGEWAGYALEKAGPRPETVTFLTSGNTGVPKPVPRSFFLLEQDARHLAGMLGVTTKRLLSLVPPHHIYGFLYSILIPKALGASCENRRFSRPAALIRSLAAGDAIIGIPHFWRICSETRERFPAGVAGITSTGPCPAEVIWKLRRQGLSVMHEIYGSSESGAMGHRDSPDAPLTLMPTWNRVGENLFTRTLEHGRTSEPCVFQDELEWLDQNHFLVKKRLDNAVQVAGVNVYPARVREAILSHEAAADCTVRLMRPSEGDRLKAFVALKPGREPGPELLASLRDHLSARLDPLEQPKSITFGETLPRNEMGKLSDWTAKPERDPMTPAQAFAKLREEHKPVAPGQEFVVDVLRPEDGWGVARLFYEVFNESFPFETYYIPDRLLEENRLGLLHAATARTSSGDIVGYGGLFRSSAPYHKVYEIGAHVVHPHYRGARTAFRLQEYIKEKLIPENRVDVFFCEAPCHQVVTQKFAAMSGLVETAVEIGLMPPSSYGIKEEDSGGRVSMLLLFGGATDEGRVLHAPEPYDEPIGFLLRGLKTNRRVMPAAGSPPKGLRTRSIMEFFDFAQAARMHVLTMGADFPEALEGFESQALSRGSRVLQVTVNLGESWCSPGVMALRRGGYFLGGLLPRWFDDDGLLMQRVLDPPDPDLIKLYSQRGHRILDLVLRDLESNPAGLGPAHPTASPRRPAYFRQASDIAEIVLTGEGLTIDGLVAAARHGRPVRLTGERSVMERVEASSSFIEWAVRTGEPIYGVNTGFGGMANVVIGEADLGSLQANLLRFLNVCAGDHLPLEDVRAAMLLRANSHLRGASGVRKELIERLLAFLNGGAVPLVRSLGSIGASGDLAPLATITGAVVGADQCFKVSMGGETISCLQALQRLGLKPLALGPKEGLGMVNGTSVMTGVAANCIYDARRLFALTLGFHALAVQALVGSNQSFHPFISRLKPHPGQMLAAQTMLRLLSGSRMCRNELDGHHDSRDGQPVQDRYSLRCLPQFLGPLLDGLRHATSAVETEMNSANDNPLIDGENCVCFHGGNFLGQYIGVWMDHLRGYIGLAAKHMDAQIALLAAPEFNGGLPASLAGNPSRPVNMGLKGLQIAANSIMPLLTYYGGPIADRFPTHAEQFNQNINSQGFNSANLARASLSAFEAYIAMALIFGVQAVSLRSALISGNHDPRALLSPATAVLYESVTAALECSPSQDKPLIYNDDEQSLEEMIVKLRADVAGDGGCVRALGEVLAELH